MCLGCRCQAKTTAQAALLHLHGERFLMHLIMTTYLIDRPYHAIVKGKDLWQYCDQKLTSNRGFAQMLFVIAAMAATFLLVPRGFSAGEIDIQSDHMSWNTTKGTYQLNLLARIPINNPNFLNVSPSMLSSNRHAFPVCTLTKCLQVYEVHI